MTCVICSVGRNAESSRSILACLAFRNARYAPVMSWSHQAECAACMFPKVYRARLIEAHTVPIGAMHYPINRKAKNAPQRYVNKRRCMQSVPQYALMESKAKSTRTMIYERTGTVTDALSFVHTRNYYLVARQCNNHQHNGKCTAATSFLER